MSLTDFMKRHPLWSIFIGALVLRLPLVDGSIDFFDSPQYLWRSAVPNLIDALSSGHAPYHPGYVLLTWLLYHLSGGGLEVSPALIALVSVLASSVSLVLVFLIARRLFSDGVAWLSTVLVGGAPYFWISSITILVDPVMIVFYLLSVWLYLEWLIVHQTSQSKNQQTTELIPLSPYFLLLTSGLSFGYALFVHTQVAFWALALPALIIAFKSPKDWLNTIWQSIPWLLGPVLFLAAYIGLLLHTGHNQTLFDALWYLIAGNVGDRSQFEIVSGARNLRLVGGSVLALFAVMGSIRLLRADVRRGTALVLWLYPGLIVSALYVYSNLVGRASIVALVPAAMLAASQVSPPGTLAKWSLRDFFASERGGHWRIGILVLLMSTLAASLPLVLSYGTQPPMMEAINEIRKSLPQGGLYVSSNEAKTLHDYPTFDVVFEQSQGDITTDINATLTANQPVFVGSDALTYPGYAVDGNHWRIFSLEGVNQAREHGSLSAYLFNLYEVDLFRQIGSYPLAIERVHLPSQRSVRTRYETSLEVMAPGQTAVLGRIVDERSGQSVSHLQVNAYGESVLNAERIDRFDWPTQLGTWLAIALRQRTRDPLFWGYTDARGVVAFPLPAGSKPETYSLVPHTLATGATQSPPPLFVNPAVDSVTVGTDTFTGTAEAVATNLAAHESALATVTRLTDGRYRSTLTSLPYTLKTTDSIKAGELSGQVSTILSDDSRQAASGQKGNVTYGPWKDLAPGRYRATWRLKRITEGEDRVLRLDVGYNVGAGTIFEQVVGAGDLPLGEWRDISVNFTVEPKMKLLEFRTLALAGPGFIVDSISITPDKDTVNGREQ